MEPHWKLWLEEDGRLVISDYRATLLELIRRASLSAAAAALGLSYRHAGGRCASWKSTSAIP